MLGFEESVAVREICLPRSTAAPIVTGSAALSVPRMVHAWWSVRPARGSCMVVRRVHGALVVEAVQAHIFLTGPSAPSRAARRSGQSCSPYLLFFYSCVHRRAQRSKYFFKLSLVRA